MRQYINKEKSAFKFKNGDQNVENVNFYHFRQIDKRYHLLWFFSVPMPRLIK